MLNVFSLLRIPLRYVHVEQTDCSLAIPVLKFAVSDVSIFQAKLALETVSHMKSHVVIEHGVIACVKEIFTVLSSIGDS